MSYRYDEARLDDERYDADRIDTNSETGLTITWVDGHVSRWDLVTVRRACACAMCNELRGAGQTVWPAPGVPEPLDVVDMKLVGAYGITFHWNDGHETGVYTWERLRNDCPCPVCVGAMGSAAAARPPASRTGPGSNRTGPDEM